MFSPMAFLMYKMCCNHSLQNIRKHETRIFFFFKECTWIATGPLKADVRRRLVKWATFFPLICVTCALPPSLLPEAMVQKKRWQFCRLRALSMAAVEFHGVRGTWSPLPHNELCRTSFHSPFTTADARDLGNNSSLQRRFQEQKPKNSIIFPQMLLQTWEIWSWERSN